jgi:hypothetical protein
MHAGAAGILADHRADAGETAPPASVVQFDTQFDRLPRLKGGGLKEESVEAGIPDADHLGTVIRCETD